MTLIKMKYSDFKITQEFEDKRKALVEEVAGHIEEFGYDKDLEYMIYITSLDLALAIDMQPSAIERDDKKTMLAMKERRYATYNHLKNLLKLKQDKNYE